MLAFCTDSFLLQQVSPRVIFRLHLTASPILEFLHLIFLKSLVLLVLVVKYYILFELVLILGEKRMTNDA
jgi:hypothetical protein